MAETDGVCFGLLMVATMTRSTWSAGTPDFSMASAAAAVARSMASVSLSARARVTMPVR